MGVPMAKGDFDAQGFYAALDGERISRGLSWKQVASEAGVSASTLTRMGQGRRPDVDSLAALSRWSGLKADSFLKETGSPKRDADTLAEMTALLRADRRLSSKARNSIEAVLKAAYKQMMKIEE